MFPFIFSIVIALSGTVPHDGIEESVELVFEATIGSKMIGELKAVRQLQNDSVVYIVTSEINAQIGFQLVQDYRLKAVYRDGLLERSELFNVVNDKVRANTKIHWDGERYIATRMKKTLISTLPVNYSVAHLFFQEPEGIEEIFSENYAEYLECKSENSELSKKYYIRIPDGSKVYYYYNKGICEQFEVRMLVFNVRYSLKKVNPLP
ncbi:DUF6134 family protein [Bacteroidota bacterium]